eukprot:181633-Pyramimonas_sp.AAC.1
MTSQSTAYSACNQAQALKTLHGLSHLSSGGPPEDSVSDPRHTTRVEASNNLLTAKHVDDIDMASTEDTIDKYVKCVEDTFVYTKDEGGNVTLDQDE